MIGLIVDGRTGKEEGRLCELEYFALRCLNLAPASHGRPLCVLPSLLISRCLLSTIIPTALPALISLFLICESLCSLSGSCWVLLGSCGQPCLWARWRLESDHLEVSLRVSCQEPFRLIFAEYGDKRLEGVACCLPHSCSSTAQPVTCSAEQP